MEFRKATEQDLALISQMADEIWWPTYRNIISDEQISFMLKDMYSLESIKEQMVAGIEFVVAEEENIPLGFAGFSLTEKKAQVYKLHKLYILPSQQGTGSGKKFIEHISSLAKSKGGKILELNVNRGNPAYTFYKKMGFEVHQIVDIKYHQFMLNDYVMRKNL